MNIKDKYLIKEIKNKKTLDPWLLEKHYARRKPSITKSYGLFSVAEKDIVGVCVYGMPAVQMNNGKCIFNNLTIETRELTRLVVNEGLPKNILSYFLTQTLKLLNKPLCIVSFADPNNGHHGYIYQATNWLYTGKSTKGGKNKEFILNDRVYHGKTITVDWCKRKGFTYDDNKTLKENWELNNGIIIEHASEKYRYIMFLGDKRQKKIMKKHLKYEILPYPKGDNKNYDCPDIIKGTVENKKENQLNNLLFE